MYALIFWLRSKTTSVVCDEDSIPSKEEGEETHAKYGENNRLYKAKIIKKSDDEEYLNCLQVKTDREIQLLKDKKISKKLALAEKNKLKDTKKNSKKIKAAAAHSSNKNLLNSSPIFEESDLEDEEKDESKDIDANEEESSDDTSDDRAENGTMELEKLIKKLKEKNNGEKVNNRQKIRANHNPMTASVSEINESDSSNQTNNTINEDPLQVCRKAGNGRVLLCEAYNVWIDKADLTYMQRWQDNPKEMTRRLLRILVGEDNLKNMCARGRSNNKPGIPTDIVNCVEYYVNRRCSYRLKPAEFTNVLNYMCGSLRNPKK